jgi:hypothetical protein
MATLTTVYGVNSTKRDVTVPAVKIAANEQYGRVRVLYDEYTVDAADEFGTSGLINLMKIPKGAKLVGAHVSCPATGTTGIFNIGWAASSVAGEDADADGIFSQIDPGAAAVNSSTLDIAGFGKTFSQEVQVQADCTEATDDMGEKTLKLALFIVVD